VAIDFSPEQWRQVKSAYHKWWQGELDRPIIPVKLKCKEPGRPQPATPLLTMENCTDLSIPAEDLIDRIDYELSKYQYLGDAFPFVGMDCFGPGVLAAFLGARLDNATGLVWFHPSKELPIEELHFQFDPDNGWFRRIREIYAAGMKRWQGQVLMGMTDIGGVLDVLSTFRPGEKLLLDLYDNPDKVKRVLWEIHAAWHECFNALNEVLQPLTPGYSHWSGIYSAEPGSMLQCDFAYMIGPDMFDDFVKPELAKSCEKLPWNFYHLDGKGQLAHLDSLLTIPKLHGVQWVPGDGAPDCKHYPEVFRKIRSAGKLVQLRGSFDVLDVVRDQLGSAKGIHLQDAYGHDEAEIRRNLVKYGVG